MKKNELLDQLEEGITIEEEFVPLLAETVKILLDELGENELSPEKKHEIAERLHLLIEETKQHKEKLLDLMRVIQRTPRNEF
ncbi:MAG: hypothetical protein JW844_08650 [Candidatus Omnitrophica bacterium]|nr:hypothetical protein [Candidatus Omnitrophota bacterium]